LTWVDNSNNEASFTIQRATNLGFTANLTSFTVPANVTTFTDTTVAPNTRYRYRVFAVNGAGNSAFFNAIWVRSAGQLPLGPTGLTTGAVTRNNVVLNWTDNATNETGFTIQRATNSTFTAGVRTINVNTPNLTTYTVTGLNPNTTYYFRVAARNAYGLSTFSNVVSATTLP
jgi:phosphodiesterase/alkaline phosphatase D-like protein